MTRTAEDLSEEVMNLRGRSFDQDAKIKKLTHTVKAVIELVAAHEEFGQRFVSTDALHYALGDSAHEPPD